MRKVFKALIALTLFTYLIRAFTIFKNGVKGLLEDQPNETYEEYEKRLREAIFRDDL